MNKLFLLLIIVVAVWTVVEARCIDSMLTRASQIYEQYDYDLHLQKEK